MVEWPMAATEDSNMVKKPIAAADTDMEVIVVAKHMNDLHRMAVVSAPPRPLFMPPRFPLLL
jgi:hypothetical protein